MPDPYANIAAVPEEITERLVQALEVRAADPQQVAMREQYFAWLDLAQDAQVLEAGCGSGPVSRHLAALVPSGRVTGLDPSPFFIKSARELGASLGNLEFVVGDAREMAFDDASFDAVVFHTSLCHTPEPEKAVAEAHRLLKPGGRLAMFDGDYSTTSLAVGDNDPLQNCVEAMVAAWVHDRWFIRRAPKVAVQLGLDVERVDGFSYVLNNEPTYFLTIFDRGVDGFANAGMISGDMVAALQTESRRRVEAGEFFGFINFVSVIAQKPE
jgi:SAM-dependent methyltransferase